MKKSVFDKLAKDFFDALESDSMTPLLQHRYYDSVSIVSTIAAKKLKADPNTAQEVASDATMQIFKGITSGSYAYDETKSHWSYVYRLAVNKFYNRKRKDNSRSEILVGTQSANGDGDEGLHTMDSMLFHQSAPGTDSTYDMSYVEASMDQGHIHIDQDACFKVFTECVKIAIEDADLGEEMSNALWDRLMTSATNKQSATENGVSENRLKATSCKMMRDTIKPAMLRMMAQSRLNDGGRVGDLPPAILNQLYD